MAALRYSSYEDQKRTKITSYYNVICNIIWIERSKSTPYLTYDNEYPSTGDVTILPSSFLNELNLSLWLICDWIKQIRHATTVIRDARGFLIHEYTE